MALTDFFRINLPYGIRKNAKGEWMAFNREYMPLGWNKNKQSIYDDNSYSEVPVYTKYKNISDSQLIRISDSPNEINRNEKGEITIVFFYNDRTNPQSFPEHWDSYTEN